MNTHLTSEHEVNPVIPLFPAEPGWGTTADDVQLESCEDLEWIAIRTKSSVYDVIVLCGRTGEVMVRGGRFCPEFRPATLAGSIFGENAVKPRTIAVGLHLELRVDGTPLVTSRILGISRRHRPPAGARPA